MIVSVCCLSARVNSCHSIFVVAFDSVSCGLIEVEITKDAPVLCLVFISFNRDAENNRSR